MSRNFRLMKLLMLSPRHQLKIFDSIIMPVMVDMVDNFVKTKFSPNMLFHHVAMNLFSFSVHKDRKVRLGLAICSADGSPVVNIARSRAIAFVNSGRFLFKRMTAEIADHINQLGRSVGSTFHRRVVALVRTKPLRSGLRC